MNLGLISFYIPTFFPSHSCFMYDEFIHYVFILLVHKQALKTVGFASTPQTTQAQGPALPQHLAAHPYSQPTLPLGPFANMIGYPFLPQNYTYVPPGFQQAFAENSTYHQSLAAVLPQYRNSISVSSLPQSNAIASGYGSVGNSTSIPGNFSVNLPAAPGPTSIGYDDIMSSQYKDNNYMLSLQQVPVLHLYKDTNIHKKKNKKILGTSDL